MYKFSEVDFLGLEEDSKYLELIEQVIGQAFIEEKIDNINLYINIILTNPEKLVKNIQNQKPEDAISVDKIDPQLLAVYHDLEEQMKVLLGTKVHINPKNDKKGKLEIEYYSQDELDRIIDLIRTVER